MLQICQTIPKMVNDIIKIIILSVAYIDYDILWSNLMNVNVSTIPEVFYLCSEGIFDENTHFICVISSFCSPADTMIKENSNKAY